MTTNEKVMANPTITGLDRWIKCSVIDIEQNPFRGIVISVQDEQGRIFWGDKQYFEPINESVCLP